MLDKIQKKIIKICLNIAKFFKEYLAQIVFLIFTFQLLSLIGVLPYFNLIAKYQFYVAGLLWILSNILFRKYISNDRILKLAILIFIIDVPLIILDLESINAILGFAAFVLLFTYICRQIFLERKDLLEA